MKLTRHIHSRILLQNQLKIEDCSRVTHAFSSHVEILALQLREHLEELLHEADKLSGQVVLVLDIWCALRETRANRLFNEQNTG